MGSSEVTLGHLPQLDATAELARGEWPDRGACEGYGELVSPGTATVEAPPAGRSVAARRWDYVRYAVIVVTLGLAVAVVSPVVHIAAALTWFLTVLLLVAAPRTWRATPAA
jgi:hypothetical protein